MNIIEIQDSLKDLPDSALMQEMQAPTGSAPQFLVLSELKRRKRMRDEFQRQQNMDMPTVAEEVVTAAGMPQQGIMGAARAMAPNTNVAQNTGMDMAAPVPATRAPQPQMMADGGVVKMRKGGVPEYAQKATFLDIVRESVNSGNWSRERSLWVDTLGEDFVREAESALLPFGGLGKPSSDSYINPRQQEMERLGIFGNSPGRNIGGEGIASVATSVKDFMVTPSYEKGTGRATMVDGTFVEVMPNGNVFDARTGEMVTGDLAQKAIAKLSPDLAGDTAAFTEFEGTPSIYRPEAGMPTQEDLDLKAQEAPAPDVFTDVSSFDTDKEYNAMQELKRQAAIERGGYEAAARAEDAPTFTGDVLPFLGDATVAAGRSLYGSTLEPAPLLEVGSVPNVRESLEEEIALINQKIATAEGANNQVLADTLRSRKDVLMRRMDTMEAGEDVAEVLRDAPDLLESAGSEVAQFLARNITAPINPELAADVIQSYKDMDAQRAAENVTSAESEAEREARIEALRDGATTIAEQAEEAAAEQTKETAEEFRAAEEAIAEDAGLPTEEQSTDAEGVVSLIKGLDKQLTSKTSGGFGSTDSRIAKMLADRQKEAESDKWMALAYAGMELMKPTATIGEGLGKAGQAGLGYLTKSKKGLRDFETDMLKLQTQLDMANIRAAASGKTSGRTSATAYAALERAYENALVAARENPSKANIDAVAELETLIDAARAEQFGVAANANNQSGAGGFKNINLT